jgi:hypothetical protein
MSAVLQVEPRIDVHDDGIRPGLSTVVPPGAYRGTEPWMGHDIFLKGLRAGLKAHPEKRRNASVKHPAKDVIAEATFMAAIEMLADAAAHDTGRGVQVSKKTIADALGCSLTTVQRIARIAAEVVECLVVIIKGRELSKKERIEVWQQIPIRGHRLKQRGVPPVRAFHVPKWLRPFMFAAGIQAPPVDNPGGNGTPSDLQDQGSAHLSARGRVCDTNPVTYTSPSEPTNSKSGSLRSPCGPGSARTAPTKKRRARPARELAIEVVKRLPVVRSESPRRLENTLQRFVESRPTYTAEDIQIAYQRVLDRRGVVTALPDEWIHTRPAVVFASVMREIEDPQADHPRLTTIDPADMRCGRAECQHGWIVDVDSVQELLGLQRDSQRRCDQCRPGAWPEPTYEELYGDLDEEEPF